MVISVIESFKLSLWLEQLLAISMKGLLVLIIAAGLCYGLRRASASARHLVWSLALAGLIALPILSLALPSWRISVLPSFQESATQPAASASEPLASAPTVSSPLARQAETVSSNKQPGYSEKDILISQQEVEPVVTDKTTFERRELAMAAVRAGIDWPRLAFIIWLGVALIVLARLIVGTMAVRRMRRQARDITDVDWISLAEDISHRLLLTRRVTLLESERVTMPMTCGLLRHVVLLPADCAEWPDERRQVVLLHELAHVKRWDCLTQLLAQLACAVYWFNPMVWMTARRLRIERELACDDQVLDAGTRASDYADHLLDIARSFHSARCTSLAAVAIARRSQLEDRLVAILDPRASRSKLNRIASVSVALLIVCLVLPLSALRFSSQANTGQSQPEQQPLTSNNADAQERHSIDSINNSVDRAIKQAQQQAERIIQSQVEGPPPPPAPGTEETGQVEQVGTDAKLNEVRAALKAHDLTLLNFALSRSNESQEGNNEAQQSKAVDALIEALKDSDSEVREQAAWALGLKGNHRAVDALIAALSDASPNVREKAAWSLGLKGDARSVEPLINALRDESADVREKAAWSLGLKGDRRAVEPLMAALKDSNPDVREMAAWALGLKGDRHAMNALKEATKDESLDVRKKAAWALGLLLMRYSDGDNDTDVNIDPDPNPDPQIDRAGRAGRGANVGISGGVGGGISGGVRNGVRGGVSQGISGGVATGVSVGVAGGVSGGIGIGSGISVGVREGVKGGVTGGVGTSNTPGKTKKKLKQK